LIRLTVTRRTLTAVAGCVVAAVCALAQPAAAQDSSGPQIADLHVDPSSGPTGTVYTISVRIVKPRAPNEFVPVLHQIRENTELIDIPIHDDGLDGDAVKGDGIYTGRTSVPGTAATRTHHFDVFILDAAGRKSNVLDYRFTVLPGRAT